MRIAQLASIKTYQEMKPTKASMIGFGAKDVRQIEQHLQEDQLI